MNSLEQPQSFSKNSTENKFDNIDFSNVSSFDELIEAIRKEGGLQGSEHFF
jgi:hypothetical protein